MDEQGHPDFIYDPDEWEYTAAWKDRQDLAEDIVKFVGEIKRFETLCRGADKWAALVPVSFDEDGDPDETEVRWFDSEADARRACGVPPEQITIFDTLEQIVDRTNASGSAPGD